MTKRNGLPCRKCGTSKWYKGGACIECARISNSKRTPAYLRTHQYAGQSEQCGRIKHAETQRRYRKENPEKVSAYKRHWEKENPDKVLEHNRRWREGNPDSATAIRHRRRSRATQAGGSYTPQEWRELCSRYGNKCLRCGRNDVKLTFDHVMPVSKGGTSDISNGQPLCGRCNAIKGNKHIDYRPDAGIARWIQAKLFG